MLVRWLPCLSLRAAALEATTISMHVPATTGAASMVLACHHDKEHTLAQMNRREKVRKKPSENTPSLEADSNVLWKLSQT